MRFKLLLQFLLGGFMALIAFLLSKFVGISLTEALLLMILMQLAGKELD